MTLYVGCWSFVHEETSVSAGILWKVSKLTEADLIAHDSLSFDIPSQAIRQLDTADLRRRRHQGQWPQACRTRLRRSRLGYGHIYELVQRCCVSIRRLTGCPANSVLFWGV
jgi:hypothetical protein